MFDRFARARSPRWRTTAIIATTAAHAAVISAVVIAAFWKIDKVPVTDKSDIRFAVTTPQEPPGSPPPGDRLQIEVVPRKTQPKVPVQPEKTEPKEPIKIETPGGATGLGTPGGGGTGEGPPDSTEIGDGTCGTPPCGTEPKPEPQAVKVPPKEPEPVQVQILPPKVAAGLRISNDDALYPSDPVRLSIVRDGKDEVKGTFKLCVTRGGRVDQVDVISSTGYQAYDGELTKAIRAWTFRPYLVNGEAAPMCTIKIVRFRLKH